MSLPIYFAPLEGVTDSPFRSTHSRHFTGVAKYFIPFISPTQNLVMTPRDLRAVLPQYNEGMHAVPQVLARDPGYFLWAAQQLHDMGYTEINLNLGCPSGTVTAKGKGSGMLANRPMLEAFLNEVYARSPVAVSIKTRIGFASPDEFEALLMLFSRYPVHELIVHPRTRSQFYKGEPYMPAYAAAHDACPHPLVYNGDLFTAQACRELAAAYPRTAALMLGRGLIANPALAQTLAGGPPLTLDALRSFHDDLFAAYQERYPRNVAIGRMIGIMNHLCCCFENADKPNKAIRKSKQIAEYEDAVSRLFSSCPFKADPYYISWY
ncbi:MAG: tRNA-dihydrouridine synthase family protein [Clostridia bacterium]|nr:tRNA-dihydrouridine synthase family protein [Clostridia bacterium]